MPSSITTSRTGEDDDDEYRRRDGGNGRRMPSRASARVRIAIRDDVVVTNGRIVDDADRARGPMRNSGGGGTIIHRNPNVMMLVIHHPTATLPIFRWIFVGYCGKK